MPFKKIMSNLKQQELDLFLVFKLPGSPKVELELEIRCPQSGILVSHSSKLTSLTDFLKQNKLSALFGSIYVGF